MKAFDEILGLVRRYAPTLVAHLILLVWLSLFVLDTARLPDGAKLWTTWSGDVDKVLKSVGIDAKAWYVIAGLALAYLTLFQWLCRAVTSLPVLRARYWSRYDDDLLAWACQVLRLDPTPHVVERTLDYHVERALERVRQANQREPYQHLTDQRLFITGWYGNFLIFLALALAWRWYGASYAVSPGRVSLTVAILVAGALGLRWYIRRLYRRYRQGTAYWVLGQQERDAASRPGDPLSHERRRTLQRRLKEEAAFRRSPATLISRLLGRLPAPWRDRLSRRINYPRRTGEIDWLIAAAERTRHADAAPVAGALDPQVFAGHFAPLLEREGSGLAVLTPSQSGLSLVGDGGSVYSFLTRRHEYSAFGISLQSGERLDEGEPRLLAHTGDADGFVAGLGAVRIEKLVAGVSPPIDGKAWNKLRRDAADAPWISHGEYNKAIDVEGVTVAREVPLRFGDSYIVGIRTQIGAMARVVLQAFRISDSDRVLIAWCILDVDTPRDVAPAALPWWKPQAWRGLIREPA